MDNIIFIDQYVFSFFFYIERYISLKFEKKNIFNILSLFFQHMKRTGWVKRNIPDPETIAGHMYRMAMLSFLVDGKENLDKTK